MKFIEYVAQNAKEFKDKAILADERVLRHLVIKLDEE